MEDLTKWTRKDLAELKIQIQDRLVEVEVEVEDRTKALAAAENAAQEFGFSLRDLFRAGEAKKSNMGPIKSAAVAKYANPESKDQTWSGRGRRPAWFLTAMEAGITPGQMEI